MPSLLRNGLVSPEADSFSTPPQTPNPPPPPLKPSLSRKASTRLSSINIPHNHTASSDIQLDLASPESRTPNGSTSTQPEFLKKPSLLNQEALAHHVVDPNDKSPCLVHWHLDKGGDLTKITQQHINLHPADLGVAKSLQMAKSPGHAPRLDHSTPQIRNFSPDSVTSSFTSGYEDDDDDGFVGSLTTRLAETAVGVREMSKQLGMYTPPPHQPHAALKRVPFKAGHGYSPTSRMSLSSPKQRTTGSSSSLGSSLSTSCSSGHPANPEVWLCT